MEITTDSFRVVPSDNVLKSKREVNKTDCKKERNNNLHSVNATAIFKWQRVVLIFLRGLLVFCFVLVFFFRRGVFLFFEHRRRETLFWKSWYLSVYSVDVYRIFESMHFYAHTESKLFLSGRIRGRVRLHKSKLSRWPVFPIAQKANSLPWDFIDAAKISNNRPQHTMGVLSSSPPPIKQFRLIKPVHISALLRILFSWYLYKKRLFIGIIKWNRL